jgi:PD-(D/E)XK nuclease superfamily protein
VLTTNQKGAIAEAAVAYEASRLGVGVWLPISGHEPYDLILDIGSRLLRVQCKWAALRGDVVDVACLRRRRGPDGFVKRQYHEGEIDAIAAHCEPLGSTYLLPVELSVGRDSVRLRVSPARNNQKLGIRMARDFEFGATMRKLLGP